MDIYIVDIDGTIADLTHRLHFIQGDKKDWDSFHAACMYDKPIKDVLDVVISLENLINCELKFVTGRPESSRKDTQKWLAKAWELEYDSEEWEEDLFMRKDGDFRPDYVIKKEIYDSFSDEMKGNIRGVFEDREQVVKMWRSLGLTCFQVKDGDY